MKMEIEGKTYYDLEELTKLLMEALLRRRSCLEEVKDTMEIVDDPGNDLSRVSTPNTRVQKSMGKISIAKVVIAGCLFSLIGVSIYRFENQKRIWTEMYAHFLATNEEQGRQLKAYSQRIAELEIELQALKGETPEAKGPQNPPRKIYVFEKGPNKYREY